MRIYLIGFPGSGKTFTGRKLAAQLDCRFLDLDDLIVQNEGTDIPTIFDQKGEDYFRNSERKALHQSSQLEQIIISAGGGTPCFFDNMTVMKNTGVVVFLETPIDILIERLKGEIAKRPLLKNENDLRIYIEKTLAARLPFYEQAHFISHQSTGTNSIKSLAQYLGRFHRN